MTTGLDWLQEVELCASAQMHIDGVLRTSQLQRAWCELQAAWRSVREYESDLLRWPGSTGLLRGMEFAQLTLRETAQAFAELDATDADMDVLTLADTVREGEGE